MPNQPDILTKHPLTLRQIITLIAFAISATFTVTKIYDRFETMEREIQSLQEQDKIQFENIKKDIERLDERITKTTGRNADKLTEVLQEINKDSNNK